MSSSIATTPRGDLDGLRSFLRSSSADDILDDAVLGCLYESTAEEVLADFGFDPYKVETRRLLSREINAALAEGE